MLRMMGDLLGLVNRRSCRLQWAQFISDKCHLLLALSFFVFSTPLVYSHLNSLLGLS